MQTAAGAKAKDGKGPTSGEGEVMVEEARGENSRAGYCNAGERQEIRNELLIVGSLLWSRLLLLWIRRGRRTGHVRGGLMLTSALCCVMAPPLCHFDMMGCQMSRVCLRQTSENPSIRHTGVLWKQRQWLSSVLSPPPRPPHPHSPGGETPPRCATVNKHLWLLSTLCKVWIMSLWRLIRQLLLCFLHFPLQRLARGWSATRGRCAGWRWGGRSACARRTAPTSPASTLCAAVTGRRTRTSAPCCWPVAWATQTWRSCTRASAKVSLPC